MKRILLFSILCAATAFGVTVTPRITNDCLINPGMGLVFYHFANRYWAYGSELEPGDTMESIPGTSVVYLRVLWSNIEAEEGVYRWDILDSAAQNWIAKGKKVAIRIICSNQTTNATPEWVRQAGAKFVEFVYKRKEYTATVPRWEPIFDDPIFLAKLDGFARAFAARYDGDPNVAFVDIGSFGMYGEGHTGYTVKLNAAETARMARLHIDFWRERLPKTYLVISDDVSGGWNREPDDPTMKYCRDHGVGFRDDSIFCFPKKGTNPNCPFDCWAHDNWARLFAPTLPVVVETGHYKGLGRDGDRWEADKLVPCAEAYRASYFSIHGFPQEIMRDFPEEYAELGRRVGYRFEPRSITYPETVRTDEPVTISSTWVNSGTAICHAGAALTWSLVNAKGVIVWSVTDPEFEFRVLEPTIGGVEKPVTVKSVCRFGHTVPVPDDCDFLLDAARKRGRALATHSVLLKPGTYDLAVSVGSRQGTPVIALPLEGAVGGTRRYVVGKMKVVE